MAALIFTLCLCSIPRLGFLPSDAPAAQVSDSSYPLTSPHMQIQFLFYTNVYTFVLHVCSDPLPAVFMWYENWGFNNHRSGEPDPEAGRPWNVSV